MNYQGDLWALGKNENFQISSSTNPEYENLIQVKLKMLNKMEGITKETEHNDSKNYRNITKNKIQTKGSTENIGYMSLDDLGNKTISIYQKILKVNSIFFFKKIFEKIFLKIFQRRNLMMSMEETIVLFTQFPNEGYTPKETKHQIC